MKTQLPPCDHDECPVTRRNEQRFTLKPRHRWFYGHAAEAEDWHGPHETIEKAAQCFVIVCQQCGDPITPVHIAQGRRLTKAEREEFAAEHTWQIETGNAMKITLPENRKDGNSK